MQWDLALFPADSGAAFTEEEEAFFRAGDEIGALSDFDDFEPRSTAPSVVVADDDEEWEWQIAIARARATTDAGG